MKEARISRRTFILSVAAVGGALVAGVRSSELQVSSDATEVYNWIVVAPNNTVTLRVAQVEMGQGAATTMAQLLAEELEVDLSRIKTEFISLAKHLKRGRVYGRTNTAASEGVSSSHLFLRTCGAQIRTMFVRAAAKRLRVSESELVAENSCVIHSATGRILTYGELASDAASEPVPDPAFIRLKDPRDWKYIGIAVARLDIPSKASGGAIFGIDVNLPGMLHAAIAISPTFGGKLVSYCPDAALSRPGVRKVVTLKGGSFDTQEAIAVVADRWWQAKTALDTISVQWDEGALKKLDSDAIFNRLRNAINDPADKVLRREGDVDTAIASAAQILEADYFVPYLEHATMEPMNCTALVSDDRFEVWAPTQIPESAIRVAAAVADIPFHRGELHVPYLGGGFGRRQEHDFVAQAVQIAKAVKGTPVKLLWSREDTMRHGIYRPANLSRMRGAFDKDGRLAAWLHRIVALSSDRARGQVGSDSLLYAIPNILVDLVVRRSHVPEGQMRGVGFATHGFVTQSFVDELARAAAIDTYVFQRTLLDPKEVSASVPQAFEGRPSQSSPPSMRVSRLRAVLDEAAARVNWGSKLGPKSGRGIAVEEEAGSYFAVVIEVTLDGEGWFHIDRVLVVGDPGMIVNPDNANAQVEGSVAFALTSAIYGEITIREGRVMEGNFDDYKLLRIDEMPRVEIYWSPTHRNGWGGIGEPVVAAVAPALTNAIYDAGGPRIRSLPLKNHKINFRNNSP